MFWGSWRVAEVLQGWKKDFPFSPHVQQCRGVQLLLCWVLTASLGLGGGRAGRKPKCQWQEGPPLPSTPLLWLVQIVEVLKSQKWSKKTRRKWLLKGQSSSKTCTLQEKENCCSSPSSASQRTGRGRHKKIYKNSQKSTKIHKNLVFQRFFSPRLGQQPGHLSAEHCCDRADPRNEHCWQIYSSAVLTFASCPEQEQFPAVLLGEGRDGNQARESSWGVLSALSHHSTGIWDSAKAEIQKRENICTKPLVKLRSRAGKC